MSYILKLEKNEPVTHDTHHLVFVRPEGFEFTPGQAVDLAILREGLRDEKRPFTMVNTPDTDTIEFIIKSYPDHDGVTKEIPTLRAGEQVEISEPWGAIHDEGGGTFIAGGAGVTPFISILRTRAREKGSLADCTLIFSNKTEEDIILHKEFEQMPGLKTVFTVTDQEDADVHTSKIDKKFLSEYSNPKTGYFYICGPDAMLDAMTGYLKDLGVEEDRIITEDFS